MIQVCFYEKADDAFLKFAVIAARQNGKWIFCKHKQRSTYEMPGGHREPGEDILACAKRELFEETGAVEFTIRPVCVYSVKETLLDTEKETFGMLYSADVYRFDELPDFEMEKILVTADIPGNWTYPLIQPKLMEKVDAALSVKRQA